MKIWRRHAPIIDGCPKGFYYDDFVETNDQSAWGFVRGVVSTHTDNSYCMYLILTDTGDVIPIINRGLRLVFRIADPEAREVAIAAYFREKAALG